MAHSSVAKGSDIQQQHYSYAFQRTIDIVLKISGHALHEKGIQKLKGILSLVGSQEERALVVLLITNDEPFVNRAYDFSSVNIGFCLFVFPGKRSTDVSVSIFAHISILELSLPTRPPQPAVSRLAIQPWYGEVKGLIVL